MAVLIIGNGSDIEKKYIENINIEYVICADGGLEKAEKLCLKPNLILGDFDSVGKLILEEYKNNGIEIVKFPSEKDYTDMELAIEHAIEKGFKDIVLIGATGTRLDHTYANLQLLEKYMYQGINIEIIDNNNHIKIISDNTDLIVENKVGYYISLSPITEHIEGLTLEGFKYPLNNVSVKRGSTLLVSNEIIEKQGRIKLKKGTTLVFVSKD